MHQNKSMSPNVRNKKENENPKQGSEGDRKRVIKIPFRLSCMSIARVFLERYRSLWGSAKKEAGKTTDYLHYR